MNVINLTPHAVVLRSPDGTDTAIPSSGICRVQAATKDTGKSVAGLPVQIKTFWQVEGLPEVQPGTAFIVSGMVLSALKEAGSTRGDVFAPATSPADGAVRDDDGRITAVTKLDGLI